jgi:hypothetical protein
MRTFLCLCSILAAAVIVSACDGAVDDEPDPRCNEPPPAAITTRSGEVLRLDVVELGERLPNRAPSFASIGMNLDGRCTKDALSRACSRPGNRAGGWHSDGDVGIDNSFGHSFLSMLALLDATPSATASGNSFLVFEGGGRATLHLSMHPASGITVSIPLTGVRLAEGADGVVTLAAIIPRAAFREAVRVRGNALVNPPSTELCAGSFLESVLASIDDAADVPLDGTPNAPAECDGISIGARFRGTPVAEPPTLLPTCEEQMAREMQDAGG